MAGQLGPYLETGIAELIGINDNIGQDKFSKSIELDISPQGGEARSGEIDQLGIYMTLDGTGAMFSPAGSFIFLDADPEHAVAAVALDAAEWLTVLGVVTVVTADYISDANGAHAFKTDISIRFHPLTSIYLTFLYTDATAINSLAADDEQMEINMWWRPVR